jgi:hypothetical protein
VVSTVVADIVIFNSDAKKQQPIMETLRQHMEKKFLVEVEYEDISAMVCCLGGSIFV